MVSHKMGPENRKSEVRLSGQVTCSEPLLSRLKASCSRAFTNMLLDIVPVSTVSQVYQTIPFKKFFFFFFFFYVLARPHSMRFLSSLTRD